MTVLFILKKDQSFYKIYEMIKIFGKSPIIIIDFVHVMEIGWRDESGYHLVAFVIGKNGEDLGVQFKNQIDPDEDLFDYVPGEGRKMRAGDTLRRCVGRHGTGQVSYSIRCLQEK